MFRKQDLFHLKYFELSNLQSLSDISIQGTGDTLQHLSNNITIYDVGLGNEKTSEKIYIHPTNSGGSTIVEHTRKGVKNFESKEIPIHKLDDYNIKKIDFIKIDVESYEWHVIKGAHQTLENQKPLLMIELMMRYQDSKRSVTLTHNYLVKNLGYRLIKMFNEDWVYSHPESINEKAKRWPLAGR